MAGEIVERVRQSIDRQLEHDDRQRRLSGDLRFAASTIERLVGFRSRRSRCGWSARDLRSDGGPCARANDAIRDQSMLKLKSPDRGFRICIESPSHRHTDLRLDDLN